VNPRWRATRFGRLAALGSAASFASVAALAGLAYDVGAVPMAVVTARLGFGALAALGMVLVLRRPWALPRRETGPTLVITVAWLLLTFGYMASFYYIPVSLAVLIFFTFPVQIALVAPLLARRRPEPVTLTAALVAFGGLALSLGPDVGALDWRGCALAFLAAVASMFIFLASRRMVVEQDMFTFSFNLHALCAAVLVVYALGAGGIALPTSATVWASLLGIGVFYIAAVVFQFTAIRLAGPARASIVFNAEPILTMVAAALLLGERLGPWQLAGAGLVVAAVLLSTRADARTG
jgi:drug/metabolite transporter (DMT)-like permease